MSTTLLKKAHLQVVSISANDNHKLSRSYIVNQRRKPDHHLHLNLTSVVMDAGKAAAMALLNQANRQVDNLTHSKDRRFARKNSWSKWMSVSKVSPLPHSCL